MTLIPRGPLFLDTVRGGGYKRRGDQGRATNKEEAELDKIDKALATKATTKEELEVMIHIYCPFQSTKQTTIV